MEEVMKAEKQQVQQACECDPWTQGYTWTANGNPVSVTPKFVHVNVMKGNSDFTLDDVIEFILFCMANKLDPIAKDCYAVKYNGRMSMLTSVASFEKRAESFPEYDGMDFGIMVQAPDGNVIQRDGQFKLKQEKIVGGWCKVYRKDRSRPTYVALDFDEYNTGKSLWKEKPAVMITKCAEAMALRKAFPLQNSNLYIREEMGNMVEESAFKQQAKPKGKAINPAPVQQAKPAEIEHNHIQDIQQAIEKSHERQPEPVMAVPNDEDFDISENMFA